MNGVKMLNMTGDGKREEDDEYSLKGEKALMATEVERK